MKAKLLDGMDVFDHEDNLYNNFIEVQTSSANRPLSLLAISGGPRLRLLCTALQHLHKEAKNLCNTNLIFELFIYLYSYIHC